MKVRILPMQAARDWIKKNTPIQDEEATESLAEEFLKFYYMDRD